MKRTTRRFARAPIALAAASLPLFAQADSGIIADNQLGLPLGVSPIYNLSMDRDPRGKSTMIPPLMRTPWGLSYDWTPRLPSALQASNGWSYSVGAEFGLLGKDAGEGSNKFREYRDWRDGLLVNQFRMGGENAGGRFFDLAGGFVGRDDQYYRATLGQYGSYRGSLFFTQIPHVFINDARTPYFGVGTGTLRLPAGLTPGNNTPAQVLAAVSAANPIELSLQRKRAGIDFEVSPSPELRYFARYTLERREGARPFAGTFGFNFPAATGGVPGATGGLAEIIEPIDYRSHDVQAGAQWARDNLHVNLTYNGSFFRNEIGELTWDMPFRVGPNPTAVNVQRGRHDLAPDNDYHNVKADFALAALPMRGSVSGTLSVGRMLQDDDLLPWTVNSGVLSTSVTNAQGTFTETVDLANWNTTAALPRRTADARIDTLLGDLKYSFSPIEPLQLRLKLRSYREKNRTRWESRNALTGQFGYVANDGSIFVTSPGFNGILLPNTPFFNTMPVAVRNIPSGYRRDNFGVEGDWRLPGRSTLEFGLERETYHYDFRERDRTDDDRLRLGITSRDFERATVRASYEVARRSGSAYDPNPYEQFFEFRPGGTRPVFTLNEMRKLDLSARTQHVLNTRAVLMVRDNMDLSLSGKYTTNIYDADYGRKDDHLGSVNADWSWQPSPRGQVYINLSHHRQRIAQANINDNTAAALGNLGAATPVPPSTNGSAGGPVYPLANAWEATSRDRTNVFGIGGRYQQPRYTLESSYSFARSRYAIGYSFASGGALTANVPGFVALAGSGMPDMTMRRHILETSLKVPVHDKVTLRFYHRYERARFEDWHYDGLPLVIGNELFLGGGPRSFGVHVLGVFLQVAL